MEGVAEPERRGEEGAPVRVRQHQGHDPRRYVRAHASLIPMTPCDCLLRPRRRLSCARGRWSGVRFLTCACVRVAVEVKDDPALGQFDAALSKIEELHEKGGCFF